MSDVTLNGYPVIRGDLKEPPQGAYTAEVEIEADAAPVGQAQLQILGTTFFMAVVADPSDPALKLSGDSGGFQRCLLVAGAGGLQMQIPADERAQGALVQDLLLAILKGSGEMLAADIDPALLGLGVPQWSWMQGTVESALSALCAYLGVIWRIRDDGKVWIGKPVPAPRTPPDYIITDIAPETGQASWSLNDISVKPDDVIDGLQVRQLLYSWEGNEFRALVTYAPGPTSGLFLLIGKWLARLNLPYYQLAPGRVAGQSGPTVQFQPDSSTISPLRKVGLRLGLPDSDVQGLSGGRGAVGWEGAAPTGPITAGFAPGPVGAGQLGKIRLGLSSAGPPSGTQPTIKGTTYRNAQTTLDARLSTDLHLGVLPALGAAGFLAAAAAELVAAGTNPAFVAAFSAAATALEGAGNALGQAASKVDDCASAFDAFENTAASNSNYLTTIVEVG